MGAFSIPAGIKVPELATPADILHQRLGIQQLANATAIQKQVMQENALKMQEQNEDRQDDKTFADLMVKHKGNFDKARDEAVTSGVRSRNLQRHDQDYLTHQRAVSSLDIDKKNRLAMETKLKGDALMGVLLASPEQKQTAFKTALDGLAKAGIDVSQYGESVPDDKTLQAWEAGLGYAGNLIDWDKKQQEAERAKQAAARAEEQAEQAKQTAATNKLKTAADEKQRAYESAARSHLKVNDQISHGQWIQNLPESIAGDYEGLETFNPQSQKTIQDMALSANQRNLRDTARSRVAARGPTSISLALKRAQEELGEDADPADVDALAEKYYAETEKAKKNPPVGRGAPKPGIQKDDRGFTPNQVKADQQKHEQLQTQENAQWRLAQEYEALLKQGDEANVVDPASKGSTPKPLKDLRATFKDRMDRARGKAQDLLRQKQQIRQIHGWDQADMVKIVTPDGRTGTIPRANLEKAKQAGAKEVTDSIK